jgi:RNA polymerase sigma factor (sigma-70 family)
MPQLHFRGEYRANEGSFGVASTEAVIARTQRLLQQYLAGDKEAERRLFETLASQLGDEVRSNRGWKKIRRRVAVEEVVGEVWRRLLAADALRKFEYQGPGSLRRLVGRYVERTLMDMHRRAHAAKREGELCAGSLDGSDPDGAPIDPRAPDPTPSSNTSASELLRICDETLDEPQRTVWRLHYDGFTHDEIGERTKLTVRQVKSALQRARARLSIALRPSLGSGDGGRKPKRR